MASLHEKNQSGEMANCPQINVITTVQLFPLASEVNGGLESPVVFHYKLSNDSVVPTIHLFPLSFTISFPSFLQDLACLLPHRDHWFSRITAARLDQLSEIKPINLRFN